MNLQKAKDILKLQKDIEKGLFSSSGQEYFSWGIKENKICLDGDFTWEELEAFSWIMKTIGDPFIIRENNEERDDAL